MSTYLYLRCKNHNPPLLSEDEVGQHLYDLPRIRRDIKQRHELVEMFDGYRWPGVTGNPEITLAQDYFDNHAARFLRHHLDCEIDIVDEYGFDDYSVDGPDPEEEDWKVTGKGVPEGAPLIPPSEKWRPGWLSRANPMNLQGEDH